jgi:dTDP-4-amino-4,6-dideoxygalactose transaminase
MMGASLRSTLVRSGCELALVSGVPAFATALMTGRPNVLQPDRTASLIVSAMRRNWLTNDGPLVQELEARFAAFQGVKHCVAVANATLGLQLAARALGMTGEILMPAFTFIGTAHALAWIGLRPVFCDVSRETHTLDPQCVEDAITSATGGILGVHIWGQPCDVEGLQRVAHRRGVPLLFDAAHATGSSYRSIRLGGFGDGEVFSLHATKSINGLEGGMVATNDRGLAERVRLLRNFGFVGEDTVSGIGINAKMNEFSAAMALANLECYDRLHAHDRDIHGAYRQGLAGLDGIALQECRPDCARCDHYAVLSVSETAAIGSEALRRVLAAENVVARRYFFPGCHRSPPYDRSEHRNLPISDKLCRTVMQLPTGLQLTRDDAAKIAAIVAHACEHADEVKAILAARDTER